MPLLLLLQAHSNSSRRLIFSFSVGLVRCPFALDLVPARKAPPHIVELPQHGEASPTSTVTLCGGGHRMPIVGFGTGGRTDRHKRYQSVIAALAAGIRHIDTAQVYKDEDVVAQAISDSGVRREEVFVTTKLSTFSDRSFTFNSALDSLRGSLQRLKMSYVDCFLIHSPLDRSNRLEIWRALLHARDQLGLARSVGVSNYGIAHLKEIQANGLELPAVNQLEIHPWFTNDEVVSYCHANGITVMHSGHEPMP